MPVSHTRARTISAAPDFSASPSKTHPATRFRAWLDRPRTPIHVVFWLGLYLTLAAKAWALLQGREYVTPEDVKSIGPDVLRHRLILTYEAEAQAVTTDAIIKKIFNAVAVP